MQRLTHPLVLLCLLLAFLAPKGSRAAPGSSAPPPEPGPVTLGAPIQDAALSIYPVFGRSDARYANYTSLDRALKKGVVDIRERGPSDGQTAEVNNLILENRGKKPVVVLAGSVVNGGKQDRQIAQDFVVPAGATQIMDAFCVEQGRWETKRGGKNTGGKFASSAVIAPSSVRRAGQYEKNQGRVWQEVEKVNRKHKKSTSSGTLTASYDDRELRAASSKRRKRLADALDQLPRKAEVIGLAYAIAGEMRSARWFVTHALFVEHRDKLIDSALMEETTFMTDTAPGTATKKPAPSSKQAGRWVTGQRGAKLKKKKRINRSYSSKTRESKTGHSSSAVHGQPSGREVEITVDVLAKDPESPPEPKTPQRPPQQRQR